MGKPWSTAQFFTFGRPPFPTPHPFTLHISSSINQCIFSSKHYLKLIWLRNQHFHICLESFYNVEATNCPLFMFCSLDLGNLWEAFISRLFGWLGLYRNLAVVAKTEWPYHRVEITILFTWKILAVMKKCKHEKLWQAPVLPIAGGGWRLVCPSSALWPRVKVPGDFGKCYNKTKEFSGFNRQTTKFRL